MGEMERKRCETIEELETLLSRERIWPTVIIKTVTGNLRHRIGKLGEEIEEAALTDKQRVLRKVATAQQFDELLNAHVARPAWGGGAFFYCEPAHAVQIKENQHLFTIPVAIEALGMYFTV